MANIPYEKDSFSNLIQMKQLNACALLQVSEGIMLFLLKNNSSLVFTIDRFKQGYDISCTFPKRIVNLYTLKPDSIIPLLRT